MTDPYQVLGVSPSAGDEEIKTAYRELVRKYHPDNYQGNPLADLANDKMQEVNEAYDQITNLRRGQGNGGGPSSGRQGGGGSSTQFADIRKLINSRRMTEAEELLDGVPAHLRDGEWHFLKGTVQYSRGWLDDAFGSFAAACSMDPGNAEYRAAYNQLQWQRQSGRSSGYRAAPGMQQQNCDVCDVCAAAYCASCCCDCMH